MNLIAFHNDKVYHKRMVLESLIHSQLSPDTAQSIAAIISEEQIFAIAENFDAKLDPDYAAKNAAFYTPHSLVASMVDRVFALWPSTRPPPTSIADISCGAGIFLLEAFRQSTQRFDISPLHALKKTIGVDLDPNALKIAQFLFIAQALKAGLSLDVSYATAKTNFAVGNALISHIDLQHKESDSTIHSLAPLTWAETFPDKLCNQSHNGFDIIIGNPPYGLSRAQRISSEETSLLKQIYSAVIGGRINTYLLFINRAFSLLSPGGILSFVVPNAWLGINEAAVIRHLLIDSGSLCEISSFRVSPFKKIGVEVITFIAQKNSAMTQLKIETFHSAGDRSPLRSEIINYDSILKDPLRRISLNSSQRSSKIIDRMEALGVPLNNTFKPAIGLQAYGRGKGDPPQTAEIVATHPFHSREPMTKDSVQYLEGKDIAPFQIRWGGSYLHYGAWLAEHQPISRYQTPRVLLREILAPSPRPFQAVFTRELFVYNRSILHIHGLTKFAEQQLPALAAIFNSSLAGFWLSQRGRKSQRKLFPKIVVHDLRDFPLISLSDEIQNQLNFLYQQLEHFVITAQQKQIVIAQSQLDSAVADLYQVTVEEVDIT